MLKQLVNAGAKDALLDVFQKSENCGFLHLREFEIIARIEEQERKECIERLWQEGDSYQQLLDKIRTLKFAIKRVEYLQNQEEMQQINENFSVYAVEIIKAFYC